MEIPIREIQFEPAIAQLPEKAAVDRRPSTRASPAGKNVLDLVPHSVGQDKPAGIRGHASIFCFDSCLFGCRWRKNSELEASNQILLSTGPS